MNIVFVVVAVFGAIIWSLYIINPPGVDEQNKHPERAAEIAQEQKAAEEAYELRELGGGFESMDDMNDAMRDTVNKSTVLPDAEKKKMLEEIDGISAHLKAIEEEIAGMSSSSAASASAGSAEASASASSAAASAASG